MQPENGGFLEAAPLTAFVAMGLAAAGRAHAAYEGADTIKKVTQAGRDQNIDFHLARVKPDVLDVLQRDGAIEVIGTDRIHDDIAAAVEMHERLNPAT